MGAVTLAKASFMALDRIERTRPRSRSGAANPTRAHVHPNSRKAGTFEDDFFYSYAKGETDRLYKKAVELKPGWEMPAKELARFTVERR